METKEPNNTQENIQNINFEYDNNKNKQNFIKTLVLTFGFLILISLIGVLLINISNNKSQIQDFTKENEDLDTNNNQNNQTSNTGNTNTVYTNTGNNIDTAPTESTSKDCDSGKNDDYLHPERFINPDGTLKCADGIVIFDHQITPKYIRTIIPYVKEQTGFDIDFDQVDFYITLPATGEEVVYQDIFNWYENGQRTIFNTNKILWDRWGSYIGNSKTYDFGVKMIHRPTGADISIIFKDHTTMRLYFDGLN